MIENVSMQRRTEYGDSEAGLTWVSTACVDTAGRVKIPPALVEDGVLDSMNTLHWGYRADSAEVIVTSKPVQVEDVRMITDRVIGGKTDGHRCTIPHQLRQTGSEKTHIEVQNAEISLDDERPLHFIYHNAVANSDAPYCFVLTSEQVEQRLFDGSNWL